jgi:hypothetical protein
MSRADEEMPMTAHSEVRFAVDEGVELGAWLYLPNSDAQRCPAITMAHGFAGVMGHGITRFAEAFVDAGFAVLPTITGPSASVAANRVKTLIPGGRSPIGVAQSPIWKPGPKWIRSGSDCGAPAMLVAMRWFLAPPIAA